MAVTKKEILALQKKVKEVIDQLTAIKAKSETSAVQDLTKAIEELTKKLNFYTPYPIWVMPTAPVVSPPIYMGQHIIPNSMSWPYSNVTCVSETNSNYNVVQ